MQLKAVGQPIVSRSSVCVQQQQRRQQTHSEQHTHEHIYNPPLHRHGGDIESAELTL